MAAQQPVHFALAPALANVDIIDFTSPNGSKIFKAGTEALSIKFDCHAENLQLFLDQLRDKAIVYDWIDILSIPIKGDPENSKDIIESYGDISYQQVREHILTYANENTRATQDSFMMYHCIMNSLTDNAQRQVRSRGNLTPFAFGGRGSGPLLLKVVVMVSHVDTRSTVTMVRTKLSGLDLAMREKDSDIEVFNDYVIDLISKLHARGEQT